MMEAKAESGGSPPPLAVYHTRWQEPAGGAWQSGLDFALGFTWDSAHQIPQPVVQLMEQDLTQYAAVTVDSSRRLVVAIDLSGVSSVVCNSTPEMYLGCTANLSADGETFSGSINQLCSGAVKYNWEGRCELLGATWLRAMNRWMEVAIAYDPGA